MTDVSYIKHQISQPVDLAGLCSYLPERYPAALISTTDQTKNASYDILFAYPQQEIILDRSMRCFVDGKSCDKTFLARFDSAWDELRQESDDSDAIPFRGGWFLYLSYELAAEIEPSLDLHLPEDDVYVAMAQRIPAAIIHEIENDEYYLIVEKTFEYLIEKILTDIQQFQEEVVQDADRATPILASSIRESDEEPYLDQLEQIKRYIREGDIFQANLSRAWDVSLTGYSDDELFKRLSVENPGSFSAMVHAGTQTILSSSPERLVSVKDNTIQTRPIAGTRPRSKQREHDDSLSSELLAHPKERAEHIMLIDLERNDLGKICEPGSIEVDELMVLESYQHVHHIVSNIRGRLRPDVRPGEVIHAVFPGGTITGCPKVRCMQILSDMERDARGPYTGSVGYINHDGSLDLNILIRTFVRKGDEIRIRAGGGIVADSDPIRELEETRAKAKGLLRVFA